MAAARQSAHHSPSKRTRLLRWLFYPFLLAQEAPEPDGSMAWQLAFDDALRHTVGMATEFALGPGPISAVLELLLQRVMPGEFQQFLAAMLAGCAAAGAADAEEEQHLRQLQRQLVALQYWQQYNALSMQYHEWMTEAASHRQGGIGEGPLLAAGQQLASSLLAFATSDGLREICDPDQDLEDPAELVLLVTGDASWDGGAAGAAVGEYPRLSKGALSVLRGQVAAALERATADTPDVQFEVDVQQAANSADAAAGGAAGTSGAGPGEVGGGVLV